MCFFPLFRLYLPVSFTSWCMQERGFFPNYSKPFCFCLFLVILQAGRCKETTHVVVTLLCNVSVSLLKESESLACTTSISGSRFTFWMIFSCCYFHSFCGHWGYLLFLFGDRVKELSCGEGSGGAVQGCWEVPLSSAATTALMFSVVDASGCWRSSR